MRRRFLPLATWALRALPPETAHRTVIQALKHSPFRRRRDDDATLRTEVFGLTFPNPLGLAAGFDKSAEAIEALGTLGFGSVEVGTLTPKPQAGNPKPRLYRLTRDRAIINRMGFNNEGYATAATRLAGARRRGIVGINIGPNKDSTDRVADYVLGIQTFSAFADYFSINISSPNTPGLRDLHAHDEFAKLVDAVLRARDRATEKRPVLVKISPDVMPAQLDDFLDVALDRRIDGLIVSNTSIARPPGLKSAATTEGGGLSGRPIFEKSTRLLAQCFLRCRGILPIIGVGGVEDSRTALIKIEAGATLLQIYTGFIYRGPSAINEILEGLGAECRRRNLPSHRSLVGSRAAEIAGGAALVL